MYVELGCFFNAFKREEVATSVDGDLLLQEVEDRAAEFSHAMDHFFSEVLQTPLVNIGAALEYACSYFALNTDQHKPSAVSKRQ